jgi:hypothetical protein
MIILRSVLLRTRNVSNRLIEKIKAHILCSGTFLSKIVPFIKKVGKYFTAWYATDDNMAHAHGMLDT